MWTGSALIYVDLDATQEIGRQHLFESEDQQIGFEEEAYSFAACKEKARAFIP